MIGQTLGHYHIFDKIGEGGMGVVYRAHDEQLDRDVAIKILRPVRGDESARKRFRKEAFALARCGSALSRSFTLILSRPKILSSFSFSAFSWSNFCFAPNSVSVSSGVPNFCHEAWLVAGADEISIRSTLCLADYVA
jgi:serine/threonine protein kinase